MTPLKKNPPKNSVTVNHKHFKNIMKKLITTSLVLSSAASLQAEDFTALIRQTASFTDGRPQSVKFLENTSGHAGSTFATREDFSDEQFKSAKFELFSISSVDSTSATVNDVESVVSVTKHDTKITGIYIPSAEIEIIAKDYTKEGYAKTRVNEPVDIKISVDGLIVNDPEAQEAARTVIVSHGITKYAPGKFKVNKNSTTTELDDVKLRSNKTHTFKASYITQISAGNNALAIRGEENITVSSLPDYGFDTNTQLASEKLLVLPMTTATIEGIEDGETFATIPSISASYIDIYPGLKNKNSPSAYGIIAYKGDKKSALTLDFIQESDPIFEISSTNYNAPKSRTKRADNDKLRRQIQEMGAGKVTVEAYQISPMGIDRLASATGDYTPEIRINTNNITTME